MWDTDAEPWFAGVQRFNAPSLERLDHLWGLQIRGQTTHPDVLAGDELPLFVGVQRRCVDALGDVDALGQVTDCLQGALDACQTNTSQSSELRQCWYRWQPAA